MYMDKKCGGIEKVPNIVIIIFFSNESGIYYYIFIYNIPTYIPTYIPIIRTLPRDDYIRSAEQ